MKFTVSPHYAQISIADSESKDYPQCATGKEQYVQNESSVVIATQPDNAGDVAIVVNEDFDGEPTFSIELNIPSGKLLIGNTMASQIEEVEVEAGVHTVNVLLVPSQQPKDIFIKLV